MSLNHIAILDADGNMQIVQADSIRICAPTPKCVQFWATFSSCVIGIAVGLFLMIYQGSESAYFNIGTGLLALAFGTLLPGPKYKDVIPETKPHSSPSTPIRATEPNNHGDNNNSTVREQRDAESFL